eukprot:1903059-Lingulodinium_polyedra.AAC.1
MNCIDVAYFVQLKLKDPRLSYVEMLKLKMEMQQELLQEWLPSSGLDGAVKTALLDVFSATAR